MTILDEDKAAGQLQRGWRLLAAGDAHAALQIGLELRSGVDEAQSWALSGEAYMALGDVERAGHAFECAAMRSRGDPAYELRLAQCLTLLRRRRDALARVDAIEASYALDADALDALGSICAHCEDHGRAHRYFTAAVARSATAGRLYNLAAAQRMTGDLDGARDSCDAAIKRNPADWQAYLLRSDLRIWTKDDNHIADMRAILAKGVRDWQGGAILRYALAKELEDVGEYEAGFAVLKEGADLRRRHMAYDVGEDIAVIDMIVAKHTAKRLAGRAGCSSRAPIFILGLPRSGTTLVERILASHSAVTSAGELNEFAIELQRLAAARGAISSAEDLVEASLDLDFRALGEAYVERAREWAPEGQYFIDKLPLNYLYCGLIAAALPEARIIHLDRDPMDSCYAMYKTYFGGAYPFSYDLDELGRYHRAYSRLMTHWRETLGDHILSVRYEELVGDTRAQVARILEHCGLGWEDACLDFHRNSAPSSTASAAQVRRPIYASSVGKWRRFEEQLRPLAGHLGV